MLVLSTFEAKHRRVNAALAEERNRFVAALADELFVAHAEPDSKTDRLCKEILALGKRLYTLHSTANANLFALGAKPFHLQY